MTDKLKAQISAFIDDELVDGESELLIRRLCGDAQLRETAARYSLIGDSIRGSLDEIRADLSGNIMRKIASEEPIGELPLPADDPRMNWSKLLGGGLIAATVAGLALFSLQPDSGVGDEPIVAQELPAVEAPVVVPTSNENRDPFSSAGIVPGVRQAGSNPRMQRYLLRHNQYQTSRQGVLSYRSLVGEIDNEANEASVDKPQTKTPNNDSEPKR